MHLRQTVQKLLQFPLSEASLVAAIGTSERGWASNVALASDVIAEVYAFIISLDQTRHWFWGLPFSALYNGRSYVAAFGMKRW